MSAVAASPVSLMPLLLVLLPFLAVPLILASTRRPNLRESWTLAAAGLTFATALLLLSAARSGRIMSFRIVRLLAGVGLDLKVDLLAALFATVASGLWIVTSVYSIGYMRGSREGKQTRYYASFAVCLGATMGVATAANLLTFVIFYEILTVATYPLVVHKETAEAISSGRKYLAYTLTAGVLLLAAAALTYRASGTLDFRPGGILAGGDLSATGVRTLFLLFVAGFGVKSALIPLHSWLPAAMVAPTPVSALLHAVAVVKSGVFGMLRFSGFIFGPKLMAAHHLDLILALLAGFTIVAASLLALRQDNLKLRLAYSTVGHLSYIVLGAVLLAPQAMAGAVLHLAFHATMKITLFFCAGAIYVHLHKTQVSELDGVGHAMPWTMSAFALAAFGLAGLPPVNGFVSKWFLASGAAQAGQPVWIALLVLSGLLNVCYLLPIVYRAFFKRSDELSGCREASPMLVAPLLLTAALSLLLGMFPDLFFRFYQAALAVAGSVFGGA